MEVTKKLRILSFSSPKGGVGRTTTLANIAAILSEGCASRGIVKSQCLIFDLDFNAPGVHYFDFAKRLGPHHKYRFRNKIYQDIEELTRDIDASSCGLVYLLNTVIKDEEYLALMSRYTESDYASSHANFGTEVYELLKTASRSYYSLMQSHIIEIIDDNGGTLLSIVPAGSHNQREYLASLFEFSWVDFINKYYGIALLDKLIFFLATNGGKEEVFIPNVLLDQEAGETLTSQVNRSLATHRIIVSGFNHQNQDGLLQLVRNQMDRISSNVKIVLSQYEGRAKILNGHLQLSAKHISPYRDFLENEAVRKPLIKALAREGVRESNIYITDFVSNALQKEYFFHLQSPSINSLIQLIISIYSPQKTTHPQPTHFRHQHIMVLGEYVGVDHQNLSGSLRGICETLKAKYDGIKVTGIGISHELIAELMDYGTVNLRMWDQSVVDIPEDGVWKMVKADLGGIPFTPDDFDLICIPYYLLNKAKKYTQSLGNPESFEIHTNDSLAPLNCDYLETSILGWKDYALNKAGNSIQGVPLFVDHQLLCLNADALSKDLFECYFENEYREFGGFLSPGDLLAYAKAAKLTKTGEDNLLLNLMPNSVSLWYEWQTILTIFGTNNNLWKESQTKSSTSDLLRGTMYYLELISYSAGRSKNTNWDKSLIEFFKRKSSDIIFVWPDAIPDEFRDFHDNPDIYFFRPPGRFNFEECWLVCKTKRKNLETSKPNLDRLLFEFLTVESQLIYQLNGGLTTHKAVLSDLSLWEKYPFLGEIWHSYKNEYSKKVKQKTLEFSSVSKACEVLLKIVAEVELEIKVVGKELNKRTYKTFEELQILNDKYYSEEELDSVFLANLWRNQAFRRKIESIILNHIKHISL